jgi:predicted DNA-binding transcriptional regulator AlpA
LVLCDDDWVRIHAVEQLTGVRKTALYQWMRERGFPLPRKPSPSVSLWNVGQVRRFIEAQPLKGEAPNATGWPRAPGA